MKRDRTEYVSFGTTRIGYRIGHSDRRRTLAITVSPDGAVAALAPERMPRASVATAMRRKAGWVVKQQDWLRRHHPRRPRQFVSGETFLYLGRQYHLRIVRSATVKRPVIHMARGAFRGELPGAIAEGERPAIVRRLLVRWYRQHALEHLSTIAAVFARRLGVVHASVRVLDMRTRWGSAGSHGHLRFNWRITMAPRRLIEYVVAHELAHMVHNRHSPEYWRLLARVMPDCEQRRQQLANLGPVLDF